MSFKGPMESRRFVKILSKNRDESDALSLTSSIKIPHMLHSKKIAAILAIFALTFIGMAATRPPDDGPKNLKVLPKNISHEDLHNVMEGWSKALGVHCSFCHAPSADSTVHHPDFASDAKPEKLIARKMYKMTGRINKKFFSDNKDDKGAMIPTISCVTCHRGNPHPDEVK